jgi:hypothetical protein
VFQGCGRITPSTASFTNNTIAGYVIDPLDFSTPGALAWPSAGGTTVNNCSFIDNEVAIGMAGISTNQTYDALKFTGNTFDTYLNNGGIDIDISLNNGSNASTYDSESGEVITYVGPSVQVRVNTVSEGGDPITGAAVMLKAAATVTSGLPYNVTVTITNSGLLATVSHTAHKMISGDKVLIEGASHDANNGVRTITYIDADSYSYLLDTAPGSNPTGTIKATFVYLYGTTDSPDGKITISRVLPTNQAVSGWARKSTSAPYYKTGPLSGTVSSTDGLLLNALLLSDE